MLLVLLLRAQQGLPARLVLTAGAEGRALQPGAGLHLPLLQPRGELGQRGTGLGAAACALQHPLQHAVALPLHGFAPGLGHVGAAGIAAGETCGHFLHRAVPAPGLLAEAAQRIFRRALPLFGQQLAPPVEQALPAARVIAGR